MPGTIIFDNEVEASGEGIINPSGNLYIEKGRKYTGKNVKYFILKDDTRGV